MIGGVEPHRAEVGWGWATARVAAVRHRVRQAECIFPSVPSLVMSPSSTPIFFGPHASTMRFNIQGTAHDRRKSTPRGIVETCTKDCADAGIDSLTSTQSKKDLVRTSRHRLHDKHEIGICKGSIASASSITGQIRETTYRGDDCTTAGAFASSSSREDRGRC